MSRISRTKKELDEQLDRQLGFLKRSAASFDEGFKDEAIRMATSVRVIVHQTRTSHSLLEQLSLLDHRFVDTSAPLVPGNSVGEMPLIQTGIGGNSGTQFFAPMNDTLRKKYILFPNWWNQIVFQKEGSHVFSRKRLVLTVSNQDGGAHVDPALDAEYKSIQENSFDVRFGKGIELHSPNDPTRETMRQITHEVITSLDLNYVPEQAEKSFGITSFGSAVTKGSLLPKDPKRNELCPCGSGLKFKKCHRI